MSFASPFLPYGLFSRDVHIACPAWKKTCPGFLIRVLGEMDNMSSANAPGSTSTVTKGDETEVDMVWGLKVPMHDGVRLNAILFRPKRLRRRIPAIFTMTPYVSDTYHLDAVYFARHGYVFVLFDVRGRGNSEGCFWPWEHDAKDGCDIVEWMSKQPWCNGKVGMWGGSYSGTNQWSVAGRAPPHLGTIVPVVSPFPTISLPRKNIESSDIIQWLTSVSGVTDNINIWKDQRFWIEKFRELYMRHLPFEKLDRLVGNSSPQFQKWLEHPAQDDYWDSQVPSNAQYGAVEIPTLTITGHYDGAQTGALHHYRQHMLHASPSAKARHYLIIGPWDHEGARKPSREVGGLKFGEPSIIDMNALLRQWYDWTLKRGGKPPFLKKRVAYYMEGAERWQYADSLDMVSKKKLTLYLNSKDGAANDAFRSGDLRRSKPGRSDPDTFTYDPLDTRPADLEREEIKNYNTDQRYCLNLFGNGVAYHSEPFAQDTEIVGFPRFVAWIAMDVPDTDFVVRLFEIGLDGSSIALADDIIRARYRKSLRSQELVEPNAVNRYEFDEFQFFARRISKGSRIRLMLGCLNSIHYQKNYNSGGVVAKESGIDARTAHIRLYHDSSHRSYLELPIAV
jgi:hypothetical protein